MTYEILDGAGDDVRLTEGRTYRFDHVGVEADAGGDVGKIVLHSGAEIKEYRERADAYQSGLKESVAHIN